VRGRLDQHMEGAGGAAVLARLAVVRQAQLIARLDAGRNVHVEHAFSLHPLLPAARRTERGDRVAGALAASARFIEGEEALLEAELAGALATWAGLDVFGTLGPAAAALLADLDRKSVV